MAKSNVNSDEKFIGIDSAKSLILSEFAELKVLLYRNRFGKIFDFIGI